MLHAVVELADNGEHSRWHAKTSKDIPQKGSVDGVVCFEEDDKAQVQGGVLLPRQFLQSSYYERHVKIYDRMIAMFFFLFFCFWPSYAR